MTRKWQVVLYLSNAMIFLPTFIIFMLEIYIYNFILTVCNVVLPLRWGFNCPWTRSRFGYVRVASGSRDVRFNHFQQLSQKTLHDILNINIRNSRNFFTTPAIITSFYSENKSLLWVAELLTEKLQVSHQEWTSRKR